MPETATADTRDGRYDFIRGVAIIMVVILHTAAPYIVLFPRTTSTDWQTLNLWLAFTHCSVPLFVMVTGALLLPRKHDDIGGFIMRRAPRTLLPLIAWLVIYQLWDDPAHTSAGTLLDHAIHATGKYHLWFLYMITGAYFAIPFVARLYRAAPRSMIVSFFVIACLVTSTGTQASADVMPKSLIAAVGFVNTWVGYLVLGALLDDIMKSGRAKIVRWALGFIVAGLATAVAVWRLSVRDHLANVAALDYGTPNIIILSACAFVVLSTFWQVAQQSRGVFVLQTLGVYSLGIYVFHLIPLEYLQRAWVNPLMYGGPLVMLLPIAGFAIATSFAVSLIAYRIPGLSLLFSGNVWRKPSSDRMRDPALRNS